MSDVPHFQLVPRDPALANGPLVKGLLDEVAQRLHAFLEGVPERVVMAVTGYLTRSMLDRYKYRQRGRPENGGPKEPLEGLPGGL